MSGNDSNALKLVEETPAEQENELLPSEDTEVHQSEGDSGPSMVQEESDGTEYPPETAIHLPWSAIRFIRSPTSKMLDLTCFILFSTFVICLILSAVIDIDVSVTGNAEITAMGGVKELFSPIDGMVAQVLKKTGDPVKENELIVRFQMDSAAPEEFRKLSETVRALTEQIEGSQSFAKIDFSQTAIIAPHIYDSAVIQALANVEHSIHNFQADRTRALILLSKNTQSGSEVYFTNQRIEFLNQRLNKMKASSQHKLLETYIDATEEELDRLKTQVTSSLVRTNTTLDQSLSELLRTLRIATGALDDYKQRHEIRAPVAGIIGKIIEGDNIHTIINKPIVTIIPANSQFIARIKLKSKDLVRLKKGQTVYYKVSAYPYQRFGLFTGEVVDFDQLRETGKDGTIDDSFFLNATINAPDKLKPNLEKRIKFYVGMNAEATVIMGRLSIKDIMMDKFFKTKEDW